MEMWYAIADMSGNTNFQGYYPVDVFSCMMEWMKGGRLITQLQQDIVETVRVLRSPFDRCSVEKRIMDNYVHHRDIFVSWGMSPLILSGMTLAEIEIAYGCCLLSQLHGMMKSAIIEGN